MYLQSGIDTSFVVGQRPHIAHSVNDLSMSTCYRRTRPPSPPPELRCICRHLCIILMHIVLPHHHVCASEQNICLNMFNSSDLLPYAIQSNGLPSNSDPFAMAAHKRTFYFRTNISPPPPPLTTDGPITLHSLLMGNGKTTFTTNSHHIYAYVLYMFTRNHVCQKHDRFRLEWTRIMLHY